MNRLPDTGRRFSIGAAVHTAKNVPGAALLSRTGDLYIPYINNREDQNR